MLYNWLAALEDCPLGWHLPSDTEWKILENYLGPNAGYGAWSRVLFYSDNEFYRFANYKKSGYSVRCLKD